MNNNIKLAFVSLGCDKNLMDTEVMLGLTREEGYTITQDESEATIIIINSCGFKMDASEEGIENILQVAEHKVTGECKGIILTGCMAQRYREEIFDSLPEVDAVVGTGDFENIGKVIKDILNGHKKVKLITSIDNSLQEKNSLKRIVTTTGGFAYIKIAEGCDKKCTYCTIPSLRGKFRSRTIDSLVDEATMLARQGVRELILVAQDTSLYGTDIYGKKMLTELLHKFSQIEDIKWIRLLYCYPEHITDELIEEMASNPKICNYIDMPFQHASDRILKLMGRISTKDKLVQIIKKLRDKMPDICIRTTFIVGFPSETNEDFNVLLDFVTQMKLDRIGVFTYSREENTPAYNMDNQIDENTKLSRQDTILKAQKDLSANKCLEFVGKTLEVIVEGKLNDEEDVYCGRSFRDCYEIDGLVFFNSPDELLAGDLYNIKITDAYDYDLLGDIQQ